jgi:SAM-dependent methyltransferase
MGVISNFTQPDTQSGYFIEFLDQLDKHRQIHDLRVAAAQHIAAVPGRRIVDLGCGVGGATFLLAERSGAGGLVAGAVAASLPNPNSARELPALVKKAGLKDVQVETFALTTPYAFMAHATGGVLAQAVERGVLAKVDVDEWLEEQAALHDSGGFFQAWLFVRVIATV